MTVIIAPCQKTRTTAFERVLLRAATGLDRYVAARLERRAAAANITRARMHAAEARTDAAALAAVGLLPR